MLSTLLKVAAVALFAVAAVKAQTPSTGGCGSYSWTELQNTHQRQGISTNDQTLDACKQSCVANSSCTGLDWDASVTPKCYLHGYWSGAKVVATGVLHIDITRTTSSSCTDCTPRWSDAIADTNVAGGNAYSSAATVDECKTACVSSSLCYGIDWDVYGSTKCWLTGNGQKRTGQAPNVQHYDLTYKPDPAQCSQAAGCIFYTSYGVVSVSGTQLVLVNDINQASAFIESSCIAKTIPGSSFNSSCVSYLYPDQPGQYMHIAFNNIDLASQDSEASRSFTVRFKEDASFVKIPGSSANLFYLSSVVYQNIYVESYSNYLRASYSPSYFYCGRSGLSDSATITGSCPRVWSRIDNAEGVGTQIVYGTSCRQSALVFRDNVIGVTEYRSSSSSWPCRFVQSTETNLDLTPSANAQTVYYELLSPAVAGPCKRGCVFTWTPAAGSVVSTWNISISTIYDCQKSCSAYASCTGVIIYNNFYCSYTTSSNPTLAIYRVFTDCGSTGSVGLMTDVTDPLAVATVSVTQADECLTACLNRKTCYGYEIRSGLCYLSVNKNAVFTDSVGTVHNVVLRNSNGNGCVHKWDLLANSKYDSGTQSMPSVTTERDCRMECIKQATCTGCDWDKTARSCSLGINNPPITKFGNSAGFNHFELQRGVNCDN